MYPGHTYDGLVFRIERLYQCLLSLEHASRFDSAVVEVLRLLSDVTGCDVAYVEVFATRDVPSYRTGYSTEALPLHVMESRVSRELVRTVVAERRMHEVSLPSRSGHETTIALCAPIGRALPVGVLYLEALVPLAPTDRDRIECVARHFADVQRLTAGTHPTLDTQVRCLRERRVREAFERHHGNISEVARALGVGRAFIYRVLGGRNEPG